jgi:hypothetical protein
MCQVWKNEVIPEQCEEGHTCPIYKKAHQLQPNNYRGITLLNTGHKILSNILHKGLKIYVEKTVGDNQCGFQVGKSTTDHIQSMRQILEKTLEYGVSTFHLFTDFKDAYGTINSGL